MSVKKREHSGIVVIDVGGEFYGDKETDDLRKMIQDEIARGTKRLLLNLYSCGMMNSTALGVMIETKKAFDAIGGEIRLCGLGHRVMKSLLVMGRLMDWFDVNDTETEAIAAFGKAPLAA